MDCSTPGLPVHQQLPEFTQTHVHCIGDAIQPSHPLPSPFPPAFSLPSVRVLSNESVLCIRWPNYWSFSFSNSTSNEYSELISFRIDWFDLLDGLSRASSSTAIWKASILGCSAFFISLLCGLSSAHDYWKNHSFDHRTFVSKVMSLLFNTLSRFVITLLPRSKHLLIYGCSHHLQWFWIPTK